MQLINLRRQQGLLQKEVKVCNPFIPSEAAKKHDHIPALHESFAT